MKAPYILFRSSVFSVVLLCFCCLTMADLHAGTPWWKFWKKKSKETVATETASTQVQKGGRDLKEVEAERKAAEKLVKREQRKALKEEKDRQEEVLRQTRESQKAIEKNQRKILSQNKRDQRRLMRQLRSKSSQPSGKRSSFLQRYGFKKKSSNDFFLSE